MTNRKITGGRYRKSRKKKKYEISGQPRQPKLGVTKRKKLKINGKGDKTVLLSTNVCNLSGNGKNVKIKNVLETPSNKFLSRRNVLGKGAIIDTEKGKARITNRPGQEGNVQAVLVE